MIKQLTIYKTPSKEFKLLKSEKLTDKHLRLYFESYDTLGYDDLIWAKKDIETNARDNVLAVEYVYEDGSARVRLNNEAFTKKLRKFEEGEIFLLIASFKEATHGDSTVHLS